MNIIVNINICAPSDPRQYKIARIASKVLIYMSILAFFVLSLTSCDNTFSIFQTISQEKKQTGADLFLNTEVRAMASDGTNYYALLGEVFYRDKSGATWNALPVNGSTTYFASGLASDSAGTVYVAMSDSNNVLNDIYATSNKGTTWTAMGAKAGIGSGLSIDWLACANDVLFVAAHDVSHTYTLFYYDTSSSSFKATGVTGSGDNVLKGIVYDGTGLYWAITSTDAYSGASPGALVKDISAGNPSLSLGLLGIVTNGSGRVLVTRSDGYAYSYSSGGAWTNFQVKPSTMLGPAFFLTQPTGSERILVAKGIASYGYMEYNEASHTANDAGSNYVTTSSSIYYGAMLNKRVLGFWQPNGDPNTLFALLAAGNSSSYSLYRNEFDATTSKWSGWTAE